MIVKLIYIIIALVLSLSIFLIFYFGFFMISFGSIKLLTIIFPKFEINFFTAIFIVIYLLIIIKLLIRIAYFGFNILYYRRILLFKELKKQSEISEFVGLLFLIIVYIGFGFIFRINIYRAAIDINHPNFQMNYDYRLALYLSILVVLSIITCIYAIYEPKISNPKDFILKYDKEIRKYQIYNENIFLDVQDDKTKISKNYYFISSHFYYILYPLFFLFLFFIIYFLVYAFITLFKGYWLNFIPIKLISLLFPIALIYTTTFLIYFFPKFNNNLKLSLILDRASEEYLSAIKKIIQQDYLNLNPYTKRLLEKACRNIPSMDKEAET
jgi:hypothetical protein